MNALDMARYLSQTQGGEVGDYYEETGKGGWHGYPHGERQGGEEVAQYVYEDQEPLG